MPAMCIPIGVVVAPVVIADVVDVGTIVNEDEVVSVDVRVELPLTPRADADVGCDDEPDDC